MMNHAPNYPDLSLIVKSDPHMPHFPTYRTLASMPRQFRAVLATQEGSTQYYAFDCNIMDDLFFCLLVKSVTAL